MRLNEEEVSNYYTEYELEQLEDRWHFPLASALVALPKDATLRLPRIGRPKRFGMSGVGIESFGMRKEAIQAVLQHYGARSQFIDVTKSIDVALWFSHYRHRMGGVRLPHPPAISAQQIISDYPPVYDIAWYEPAWKQSTKRFGYFPVGDRAFVFILEAASTSIASLW